MMYTSSCLRYMYMPSFRLIHTLLEQVLVKCIIGMFLEEDILNSTQGQWSSCQNILNSSRDLHMSCQIINTSVINFQCLTIFLVKNSQHISFLITICQFSRVHKILNFRTIVTLTFISGIPASRSIQLVILVCWSGLVWLFLLGPLFLLVLIAFLSISNSSFLLAYSSLLASRLRKALLFFRVCHFSKLILVLDFGFVWRDKEICLQSKGIAPYFTIIQHFFHIL